MEITLSLKRHFSDYFTLHRGEIPPSGSELEEYSYFSPLSMKTLSKEILLTFNKNTKNGEGSKMECRYLRNRKGLELENCIMKRMKRKRLTD